MTTMFTNEAERACDYLTEFESKDNMTQTDIIRIDWIIAAIKRRTLYKTQLNDGHAAVKEMECVLPLRAHLAAPLIVS